MRPGLVHRFAQVFIGAGYVFRTAFFLNAAFERSWLRLRWIVWGNLAFTGVLLFATYWHAGEFHWNPFETPLAHIWIVLYIFEPVVMIYLIPPGTLRAASPTSGGPVSPWFKRFLVLETHAVATTQVIIHVVGKVMRVDEASVLRLDF